MKVTDFAVEVSKAEGGKVNLPIAQISEVLSKANKKLKGGLYKLIRAKK